MEERLYTSKEIANIKGVTQYTITQNWCRKGLKHIGKSPKLFKLKWVDEFIEEQGELSQQQQNTKMISTIVNPPKFKKVHKFTNDILRLEDL